MASISTSAVVAIPSFTGLKAAGGVTSRVAATKVSSTTTAAVPRLAVKASLKEVGTALVATAAATIMLASNANADECDVTDLKECNPSNADKSCVVLLGSDSGGLVYVPSRFGINSGVTIVFKNNKAYPHNVIFYDDRVPPGVDASQISMPEGELLETEDDCYKVTLTKKGDYEFYCEPHEAAGMVGKLTVG